jgi:hypothetical protein
LMQSLQFSKLSSAFWADSSVPKYSILQRLPFESVTHVCISNSSNLCCGKWYCFATCG